MSKKEIKILVIIVAVALLAIAGIYVWKNNASSSTTSNDPNAAPTTQAKGQWVAIIHRMEVAQWFDSGEDAEYTVTGDYGEMTVEVKDGKWHVKEVECPNHTCEGMGWDDGEGIMPITCIPNNILIMTEDMALNYISSNE